ncbi:MAG TPA: MurR/RpiR family transcriptional regulator [Methanomassiliicoccales archaeon]|nr:MurR/RpiR family transcriptional regulator [Methanomassiliicoccales archaeon]
MSSARAIMFCGVGNAAVVAQEAYLRWLRIGFPVSFAADHDVQLVLASQLGPKGVFVGVSHTGKTRSLLTVAKSGKDAGAHLVAITNFPSSELARLADYVLQTAVFTAYLSGEIMSKRLAELCIVESLFINFLIRRKALYAANIATSDNVLKSNKL